jgi:hypothetical protein
MQKFGEQSGNGSNGSGKPHGREDETSDEEHPGPDDPEESGPDDTDEDERS